MAGGLFVIGMHRSGTSAATRLITFLGVAPPREDDLVPPSAKNPTGYWESMSLVWFNTRVLATVGCDMRCPVDLAPGWEDDVRLDDLRRAAPAAFRAVFPREPWAWKDPRSCLTLAFWRDALDVLPVAVLVNRNPLEIDASTRRTGHWRGKRFSLALWERYLRQALVQSQSLPLLVTSYEQLLEQPVEWTERVRAFLERAGMPVRRAGAAAILGFVDRELRHARFTREAFLGDDDVSDSQRALYLALEELAASGDPLLRPSLPPETASTETLLAERRRELAVASRAGPGAIANARDVYERLRRLLGSSGLTVLR